MAGEPLGVRLHLRAGAVALTMNDDVTQKAQKFTEIFIAVDNPTIYRSTNVSVTFRDFCVTINYDFAISEIAKRGTLHKKARKRAIKSTFLENNCVNTCTYQI